MNRFNPFRNTEKKRAFIFLVGDPHHPYHKNEEISKLYMNKIAIDEDDQLEVLKVFYDSNLKCQPKVGDYHYYNFSDHLRTVLDYYQTKAKKAKVFKLMCPAEFSGHACL